MANGINYEEVSAVCERLRADGVAPTQRNVRLELGTGSNSTILRHLSSWKDKQSANKTDTELPVVIVNTITKAIDDAVNLATAQLEAQLADAKTQMDDGIRLLAEQEAQNSGMAEQRIAAKNLAEERELELQKRLAAESKQVESLQAQNQIISEKLDASTIAQERARTESAKAQLQVVRADEATNKADKRTEELTKELDQVKNSLVVSQRDAATANAVSGEQVKSIKRLEDVLAGHQSRYDDLLIKHEQVIQSESAAKARLDVLESVQKKEQKK